MYQLNTRLIFAFGLAVLLAVTAVAQPPSRGDDRGGRSFGGSPFGERGGFRGGRGGERGGQERSGFRGGRGGFDPSGFIGRLDRNGNGMIDPDEQEGPARFMIGRLQQADPSIDPSRPIPIDRFTKAFEQMRSERGGNRGGSGRDDDDRGGSRRGGDSNEAAEAAIVELVPGFGSSDPLPPVPGFGSAAELFAVRVLPEDLREAEENLRRYDRNRDGAITEDELSRRWSGNPMDYDRNRDGKLTQAELAVRYARRRAQEGDAASDRSDDGRRGEDGGRDRSRWRRGEDRGDNRGGGGEERDTTQDPLEGRRSLRLTRSSYPEGLPGWFQERDGDEDGQVMMDEYTSRWNEQLVQEFFQFDTNRDGVITPTECLAAVENGARAGAGPSDAGRSQAASSPATTPRTAPAAGGEVDSRYVSYAERIISRSDKNGDGVLTNSEWQDMLLDPSPADSDRDGRVTVEEYAGWLQSRAAK